MITRLDTTAIGSFLCAFAWSLGAAEAPARRAAPSPSETECRTFAEQLEREMTKRKGQAFVRALDPDAMLDSALRNIGAPEQAKRDFCAGFKSGFVQNLAKGLEATSNYKLLRLRQTNEQWRAIFRLLNRDGGLNYHDLVLVRGNDARVRIADFYVAISGELMSTTIRRIALPMLLQSERSLLDRLVGTENDLIKHQKDWSRMVQLSS